MSSAVARAEEAPTKPVEKAATKPAEKAATKPRHAQPSGAPASAAAAASSTSPAPTPAAPAAQKEDASAKPNAAQAASDSGSSPSAFDASDASKALAPPAPRTVRVFMRSGTDPLLFSARAKNNDGAPTLCSAPCDARLLPGDYQLRLNGVVVDGPVKVGHPGTLQGKIESREGSREGGWLALNVGGILGGVFITVAALGGPSWTYVAGG
ncbi:MAG TPA: hypothetical protein VNW92_10095, partial [Polyangiaceae bacterium]|nr:hypothetical protein [Polyangiaceae bacterium]